MRAWSPEQIANRIKLDFPDDESMRISHEAIYQSLYIEGRGALKRELVWCLRTGRALRAPRERSRRKTWAHVTPETLISERPAEVEDRAVPGHWEGDLLIGLERSAIGTVVERTTRFTMLVHLPREEGYRHKHTIKNGPALAGYGAITMKNALAETMSRPARAAARSLTWDRGKEMSAHAQFRVETGIPVFFADPQSPWQRGTNENTNGLLRQYFPKGTDLSRWSRRGARSRRPRTEHQTPQDTRLEDTSRSLQRAATVTPTSRCCIHRLNPVSFGLTPSSVPCATMACTGRWAASGRARTTPPWSRSSACCKRTSSTGGTGTPAMSCGWPSSSGSKRPTTADADKTASLDSHPSSSRHSYMALMQPECPYPNESTKPGADPTVRSDSVPSTKPIQGISARADDAVPSSEAAPSPNDQSRSCDAGALLHPVTSPAPERTQLACPHSTSATRY